LIIYKRVYVTDKAKNIKYEIQNLSEEWNEKLFEGFSLNEKQNIINALTKMIENTKKIV
jgi:DNA-binding MarR family transcriptional regulator